MIFPNAEDVQTNLINKKVRDNAKKKNGILKYIACHLKMLGSF